MHLLELKDIHVSYGAVAALKQCSLHIDDGELVSTPSNLNGTKRLPTFVGVKGVTDIEE